MLSLLHKAELIDAIFNALETLDEARFLPVYFTRRRKMPFDRILHFMLSGRKSATQAALDEYFKLAGDETHMSQQAYSKARNNFDHSPFQKAFYAARDGDYADDASAGRFLGLKIIAVDGSIVPLPNIPELYDEFGANGAGAVSPAARASIAYDVINDQIADASIEPLSVATSGPSPTGMWMPWRALCAWRTPSSYLTAAMPRRPSYGISLTRMRIS